VAFNSGDVDAMMAYRKEHFTPELAARALGGDDLRGFMQGTGGFELKKAEESSATRFVGVLKERNSDQFSRVRLILQLVQEGKLATSDTLAKILPDYPNKQLASKVTIHHLLTHTGGTGDIFGPEFEAHRLQLRTIQDYVKLYGARDLEFERAPDGNTATTDSSCWAPSSSA
jgi:hypothetical protein